MNPPPSGLVWVLVCLKLVLLYVSALNRRQALQGHEAIVEEAVAEEAVVEEAVAEQAVVEEAVVVEGV